MRCPVSVTVVFSCGSHDNQHQHCCSLPPDVPCLCILGLTGRLTCLLALLTEWWWRWYWCSCEGHSGNDINNISCCLLMCLCMLASLTDGSPHFRHQCQNRLPAGLPAPCMFTVCSDSLTVCCGGNTHRSALLLLACS